MTIVSAFPYPFNGFTKLLQKPKPSSSYGKNKPDRLGQSTTIKIISKAFKGTQQHIRNVVVKGYRL